MGCNKDRLNSLSLQLVTGSVCTTNLQYLCQILVNQNKETHMHAPPKYLSCQLKQNSLESTVACWDTGRWQAWQPECFCQAILAKRREEERVGMDGESDALNVRKLRHS